MKLASFYIFVLFVATHFATADKIHKKEYRKSYREALKPYLLNRWDDSNFLENFWGKLETVIKDDAVLDVLRQMGSFFEKFVRTTKQSSDLAEVKFTTIPVLTGFHEGTPNAGKERKQPLEGLKKETGNGSGSVPVVLWHGMGDCCCNPLSMGSIKRQIERQVPGIYVHSLMIGNNIIEDTLNGFIMNVNDQVTQVCEKIKNDSNLANGYHAMGFSQGGQFLRAVAQRCPDPPIKNLITFGGQHQGVFGLPNCDPDKEVCDILRDEVTGLLYSSPVQDHIVQAEYWHDPRNPQHYQNASVFIAEINNENRVNSEYKKNLLQVSNFVMVQFTEDTEVVPRESEWFGFYQDGQTKTVVPLENTTLYSEDRLGLKQMDEEGRLIRYPIKGNHLQIDREDLDDIIDKYIK